MLFISCLCVGPPSVAERNLGNAGNSALFRPNEPALSYGMGELAATLCGAKNRRLAQREAKATQTVSREFPVDT